MPTPILKNFFASTAAVALLTITPAMDADAALITFDLGSFDPLHSLGDSTQFDSEGYTLEVTTSGAPISANSDGVFTSAGVALTFDLLGNDPAELVNIKGQSQSNAFGATGVYLQASNGNSETFAIDPTGNLFSYNPSFGELAGDATYDATGWNFNRVLFSGITFGISETVVAPPTPVPEPHTLTLLSLGLLVISATRRTSSKEDDRSNNGPSMDL